MRTIERPFVCFLRVLFVLQPPSPTQFLQSCVARYTKRPFVFTEDPPASAAPGSAPSSAASSLPSAAAAGAALPAVATQLPPASALQTAPLSPFLTSAQAQAQAQGQPQRLQQLTHLGGAVVVVPGALPPALSMPPLQQQPVMVAGGAGVLPHTPQKTFSTKYLNIMDPLDPANNLGRG
jgi:hypothetical protein